MPYVGNPPLSFRFGVLFFAAGVVPNPLDTLFQKVSGLGSTVETDSVNEGGQNLYTQSLPKKIRYENLVLERGLVVGSPLVIEFNAAMSLFKFSPSNVLVTLLDNTRIPIASWLFMKAYPVKWHVSDLDATANSVVIETMELAYQQMQVIRL
ncbi:MAG: phage tail protein [Anaerolineae bacterium]|nr:phage tail protein [Anaerolineae bacterium]